MSPAFFTIFFYLLIWFVYVWIEFKDYAWLVLILPGLLIAVGIWAEVTTKPRRR